MDYKPAITEQLILCPGCSVPTPPNQANMCVNCIRNEVDITDGIPKHATIHFCKNCERYLQPPGMWVAAALESRELLSICLKKLKGLSKVRLLDAGFIWTEPHSRRIKVKLTIQKEVFANTVLQQIFDVEFVVTGQQCDECTRMAAQNTWKAVVQVRQKVEHKRTFLYLEQLILKHNAHKDTTNIKETKDGIDFYYGHRAHAIKMVEFLASVVPMKYKTSERLISTDIHTSTSKFKFTYSAEIVPICRDDLIVLPKKLANSMGGISQLLLCSRISNSIHLMDLNTLNTCEISQNTYWRTPFTPLANNKALIEYYVLDVEPLGTVRGKHVLADIHVTRSVDFGRNDDEYIARSHLGGILNPGDTVMGYDLSRSNFNNDEYDKLNLQNMPDVILVRKSYPARRKKNKQRDWKIKQLGKEVDEMLPRKQDQAKMDKDMELFLRDIEEDADFRATVNIFKSQQKSATNTITHDVTATSASASANNDDDESKETTTQGGGDDDEDDDEEEDFPEVSLEEMMDEMQINNDDDAYVDADEMKSAM